MAIKIYTYARNKWFAGSLKEMPKKKKNVRMISTNLIEKENIWQ